MKTATKSLVRKLLATQNTAEVIKQLGYPTARRQHFESRWLRALPILNQTRGVVWGAERPELLITETLAFHDRRTEDLKGASDYQDDEMDGTSTDHYPDVDMDQRLRPRGSLFVELYNPWSPDGQLPPELYTRLDGTTNYLPDYTRDANGVPLKGVDLSRLSTWGIKETFNAANIPIADQATLTTDPSDGIVKRSPVWRLIVVDDWPRARNDDRATIGNDRSELGRPQKVGDTPPDVKSKPAALPAYYQGMVTDVEGWDATKPPPYRAPDPDFDAEFNSAFTPTQVPAEKNLFNIEYPYIEREFYFTTDNSPTVKAGTGWGQRVTPTIYAQDWDYSAKKFKLRIPDRYIKLTGVTYGPSDVNPLLKWSRTQKFIPIGLEQQKGVNTPVIAPILPGRYGVIGSAGTRYLPNPGQPLPNIYTTTIGRQDDSTKNTSDTRNAKSFLQGTRRIEFHPSKDPNTQQISVDSNGGDPKDKVQMGGTFDPYAVEIGRDNELINDQGTVKNIEDSDAAGNAPTGTPNSNFYQPCVTIPVEGMSASEPPWGYGPREEQAAEKELAIAQEQKATHPGWPDPVKTVHPFDPLGAEGEGSYSNGSPGTNNERSYDKPFDLAPELTRTGTTANYRTVHLQRLANPELPWNPLPGKYKDPAGNDLHRPNLPINPYRTIDSSTVNLTAFNGPSSEEHIIGGKDHADQPEIEGKLRPWELASGELTKYLQNMPQGRQVWYFRSTERGFWNRLNFAAGAGATPTKVAPPERVLWAQEPALVDLRKPAKNEILDLITGRQMTMRYDEVPYQAPDDIRGPQKINKCHCNMVLEHSLGFGNESFGLLYDKQGATTGSLAPTVSAIGAPAPGRFIFTYDVNATTGSVNTSPPPITVSSTNPWLAWGNRPYVSAEELLKVPAASQAQMLRQYATIDPNLLPANRPNPYGLAELGTQPNASAQRDAVGRHASAVWMFGKRLCSVQQWSYGFGSK